MLLLFIAFVLAMIGLFGPLSISAPWNLWLGIVFPILIIGSVAYWAYKRGVKFDRSTK